VLRRENWHKAWSTLYIPPFCWPVEKRSDLRSRSQRRAAMMNSCHRSRASPPTHQPPAYPTNVNPLLQARSPREGEKEPSPSYPRYPETPSEFPNPRIRTHLSSHPERKRRSRSTRFGRVFLHDPGHRIQHAHSPAFPSSASTSQLKFKTYQTQPTYDHARHQSKTGRRLPHDPSHNQLQGRGKSGQGQYATPSSASQNVTEDDWSE